MNMKFAVGGPNWTNPSGYHFSPRPARRTLSIFKGSLRALDRKNRFAFFTSFTLDPHPIWFCGWWSLGDSNP